MSNLIIEIKAPELAGALLRLAEVLQIGRQASPAAALPPQPAPAPVPVTTGTAPATAPVAVSAAVTPVAPPAASMPQMTPAPTAAPTSYTMEQLSVACTPIIDAGRRQDLVALLHSFGVPALTLLPKERYGEFATALRQLGAKL